MANAHDPKKEIIGVQQAGCRGREVATIVGANNGQQHEVGISRDAGVRRRLLCGMSDGRYFYARRHLGRIGSNDKRCRRLLFFRWPETTFDSHRARKIGWCPDLIWKPSSTLSRSLPQRFPNSFGFGVPAPMPPSVAVAALTVHTTLGYRLVALSARRKIGKGFPNLTGHAPLLCQTIYHA